MNGQTKDWIEPDGSISTVTFLKELSINNQTVVIRIRKLSNGNIAISDAWVN